MSKDYFNLISFLNFFISIIIFSVIKLFNILLVLLKCLHVKETEFSYSVFFFSPLNSPLQCIDLTNCSLNAVDMAYFANSLHSEHLVKLDLSGHDIADIFPNTFRKLLNRCSATLTSLALEECGLNDESLDLLAQALAPCHGLQEFKIMGNPFSTSALHRIFNMLAQGYPALRYDYIYFKYIPFCDDHIIFTCMCHFADILNCLSLVTAILKMQRTQWMILLY